MTFITIEDAQARLPELIHNLTPGEELVITENSREIAKLVVQPGAHVRPIPGRGKGTLIILADDDEHLDHFREYVP